MRHIKYFLTGLFFTVIGITVFGISILAGMFLTGLATSILGQFAIDIVLSGAVILFLAISGILLIYTIGQDYHNQKLHEAVRKDYDEWKQRYNKENY